MLIIRVLVSIYIVMQGFPVIFCYILGVKVTDLVPLSVLGHKLQTLRKDLHQHVLHTQFYRAAYK